jgi:hypothetical protein
VDDEEYLPEEDEERHTGIPAPDTLKGDEYSRVPPIEFLYTGYSVNTTKRCVRHTTCIPHEMS